MSVVTLLPQSGLISRAGHLWQGQNGIQLSTAPTTGTNSPADYVKSGITSPNEATYWADRFVVTPFTTSFYVPVDKMTLSPSGFQFKARGSTATGKHYQIRDLELWLRTEHNAGLAQNIQVASGLTLVTVSGAIANYTIDFRIVEANRSAFESGLPNQYLCVSGNILFSNDVGSGFRFLQEMEVQLSGDLPTPWNSCDLYLYCPEYSSGNFDLYTGGYDTSSGNVDLYTLGNSESSGSIDLYLHNVPASSNLDLYTLGHLTGSGSCDLYAYSAPMMSGSFDLYTQAHGEQSGTFNLYTTGPIGIARSGNFPLFIWSSTNSGIFASVPLTVYNSNSFTPQNAMNLVMEGPTFYTKTSSMNLILSSDPSVAHQFDLFLANYYSASSGWIPLIITTPSGQEGIAFSSGTMNLIMGRDFDSTANWTTLYLQAQESVSGNFPLYISGETVANSSVPLYVFGIGQSDRTLNLYSHGF